MQLGLHALCSPCLLLGLSRTLVLGDLIWLYTHLICVYSNFHDRTLKWEFDPVYQNTIYLQAQQHSFNCCLHLTAPSFLKYLPNKSDTIPKSKISAWEETFKAFAVFLMTGHMWLAKCMTQGHSDIQVHVYTFASFLKNICFDFSDMNARKHMVGCLHHQTPQSCVHHHCTIIRPLGKLNQ